MARARDSQRTAVYAWELRAGIYVNTNIAALKTLTMDQVRALVKRIWVSYMGSDLHVPIVTDGRGRRRACYAPGDHSVRFPVWSRQPGMVAHEVAHAIAEFKSRHTTSPAWHGPIFVRVYCELLVAFLGHDPEKLRHEMKTGYADNARVVRIAPTDALPWRQAPQKVRRAA